jgi:hypothetical protein
VLTVFAIPKPFVGHVGVIQRNAVRSWLALRPDCQVLLCGDEPGSAEAARELGVERLPDVDRNEFGTPLLSSVFESAELRAEHDLLCYANADVVFFDDLLDVVRAVASQHRRFLLAGGALDLDVTRELAFDDVGVRDLGARAREEGTLRGRLWIDFFVFPRGSIGRLPDFAVGRPSWDNWLIWRARSLRMPVVDVTGAATVIHQSHEYGHVQQARGSRWEGPEGDANFELVRWEERCFSLDNATHVARRGGVLAPKPTTLQNRLRTELIRHDRAMPLVVVLDRGYQWLRRLSATA